MSTETVYLVSTRTMFLRVMQKVLSSFSNLRVAEQDRETILNLAQDLPDTTVMILDAEPDGDTTPEGTLNLVRALAQRGRLVAVINHANDEQTEELMLAGAVGVLIKSTQPLDIADAFEKVLSGIVCRPAPESHRQERDLPAPLKRQLSARQQKILRALIAGKPLEKISADVSITLAKLVQEARTVQRIVRGQGPDHDARSDD